MAGLAFAASGLGLFLAYRLRCQTNEDDSGLFANLGLIARHALLSCLDTSVKDLQSACICAYVQMLHNLTHGLSPLIWK